jgi:hypothetical protein
LVKVAALASVLRENTAIPPPPPAELLPVSELYRNWFPLTLTCAWLWTNAAPPAKPAAVLGCPRAPNVFPVSVASPET